MKNNFVSAFILCLFFLHLTADEIRPIQDKTGYCWDKTRMDRFMDYLKADDKTKTSFNLIAGISPHDDYLYAGSFYFRLFKNIRCKEVVIFGVTHSSVRKKLNHPQRKIILENYSSWQGPYDLVQVSELREFIKKKLNKKFYLVSNQAHGLEHSIEGMIPFLQYFNPAVKIIPIMVTAMDFEDMQAVSQQLAIIFSEYIKSNKLELGKDIFFLISSDANHYGIDFNNTPFGTGDTAHNTATEYDRDLCQGHLSGQIKEAKLEDLSKKLFGKKTGLFGKTLWCGRYSITFGLLTVLKTIKMVCKGSSLQNDFLSYSDTYSEGVLPINKPGFGITAPFSPDHWVGFFCAGFSLN